MTGKQRLGEGAAPSVAAARPPSIVPDAARNALRSAFASLGKRWIARSWRPFHRGAHLEDRYVGAAPSLQNAVDLVGPWIGAMPAETGLRAGPLVFHLDQRLDWLLRDCFDVTGRTVLELGPLEGLHTAMLERAGAAAITAIEANSAAFLRCLVTKEALHLERSRFLLGDFTRWLGPTAPRYDLVVASGVLYHCDDPVTLLEGIVAATDAVFLWTHVFDADAMPPGDERRVPFSGKIVRRPCRGVDVRLHERSYHGAWLHPAFNGGPRDRHYWVERTDLLALLSALGFAHVRTAHEEPDHRNGPCLSVFAQRAHAGGGDNFVTPDGHGLPGEGRG